MEGNVRVYSTSTDSVENQQSKTQLILTFHDKFAFICCMNDLTSSYILIHVYTKYLVLNDNILFIRHRSSATCPIYDIQYHGL